MASFAQALREYCAARDQYDALENALKKKKGAPDADVVDANTRRTNAAFDALIRSPARSVPAIVKKLDAILHHIATAGELWETKQVIAAIRRDLAKLEGETGLGALSPSPGSGGRSAGGRARPVRQQHGRLGL
jgi:G:T/U-mismatch repair DNA glycosylase